LEPVIDLTEPGQEYVLLEPGQGGRGNFHFRSATNQVPQERELGTEGAKGSSISNFVVSRTLAWLVFRMPASRHYWARFLRSSRRSLLIHLPRSLRRLEW
jgi:hypothetical protein